ncbi:DNA glycosylase AlkZ-like family protein [Mycobacterium interjectum]|uniref:DNA glycosylase AlkZ-like family protein n=1 Tax=Mycobacterium interjectum TaxID=33895 RepID=UPI0035572CA6
MGRRGAVRVRRAHHGHPGGLRAPLRPGGAGAAGERAGPPRSMTTRRFRELTLRAATALGVGTEADIRDYFRLSAQQVKPAIAELLAAGAIERADVDGWSAPAYLRAGRTVPRVDRGTALLCPFDPLIFFRPRVERLFGFHYRIEIYTPAAQRRYGYYVWPLLMDGRLVARVDLKADRAGDSLRVLGAFGEAHIPRPRVIAALAGELRSMASWLGLGGFSVSTRGDLAAGLRAAG